MSLTKAAIQKDRITLVALAAIALSGTQAFLSLPRAEDPGFIIRVAQVVTRFPGASPERVEQLITDKLEERFKEMPEVDFITSQSKTGTSIVLVSVLESYDEMRPIWDKLRRKVDAARGDLPDNIIGPEVNDEFGDVFGTVVTLTGEGFSYAELKDIADDVRDEFLLIEEVAKVEIYGDQEEQIFVEYNNARLAELGLSPAQLSQTLEAQNIIFPGGDISTDYESIVLEPSGNFESLDQLRSTLLRVPGQRDLVYLGDLANVRRGYRDPPRTRMHVSGVPGLALAISLREGGNITVLGAKIDETVERLRGLYPYGIEFDFVSRQSDHVDRKVDDFVVSLLQAIGIVLAVMLLFLGLRTGLVVAALVPMAMIMAVWVMSIFGIGIDQMSLAALIIALGMLVDNAIVMSESIMVQMQQGKKAVDAALSSASELQVPLLTSSLTTAAAFLPIYLAESSTGEYTAPLFKVVSITLLCSWLLALSMTPMLCVRFLRVQPKSSEESFDGAIYRVYRRGIITVLRHRVLSFAGVAAAFMAAIYGLGFVPNIFFPENDKPILTAELTLPSGSPIERTEAMVANIESFIAEELMPTEERLDGVTDWASFIGEGAPRYVLPYNPTPPTSEYAYMLLNATSRDVILRETIPRMQAYCLENFPDLTASIALLPMGPAAAAPVEFRLIGRDIDVVFDLVDDVKRRLGAIPGVVNIRDDWGIRSKKLLVNVDQARAQRAGISNMDVAVSLQTVLSGYTTTEYREGDKVIPVTMRSIAAERTDLGMLESHNIFSQSTGRSVPLKQVADIEVGWQPGNVRRRDGLKSVTVQADVAAGTSPVEVSRNVAAELDEVTRDWPLGYRYELGGDYENSETANQSIAAKLPIAGLIILFLLVAQFNSIRRPAIILSTIPLAIIGVTVGLLVLRSYFGFMTLLGIISLAGIVINNAIVLIDRIKIEIEDNGLTPQQAIVEAGQRRLRPILLTTATTVGGLIPLYLGGGPMWEPMAVSIMFGLVFATALTLGFVPLMYSILFGVRFDKTDAKSADPTPA